MAHLEVKNAMSKYLSKKQAYEQANYQQAIKNYFETLLPFRELEEAYGERQLGVTPSEVPFIKKLRG